MEATFRYCPLFRKICVIRVVRAESTVTCYMYTYIPIKGSALGVCEKRASGGFHNSQAEDLEAVCSVRHTVKVLREGGHQIDYRAIRIITK